MIYFPRVTLFVRNFFLAASLRAGFPLLGDDEPDVDVIFESFSTSFAFSLLPTVSGVHFRPIQVGELGPQQSVHVINLLPSFFHSYCTEEARGVGFLPHPLCCDLVNLTLPALPLFLPCEFCLSWLWVCMQGLPLTKHSSPYFHRCSQPSSPCTTGQRSEAPALADISQSGNSTSYGDCFRGFKSSLLAVAVL